jgi:hypothetical protein
MVSSVGEASSTAGASSVAAGSEVWGAQAAKANAITTKILNIKKSLRFIVLSSFESVNE